MRSGKLFLGLFCLLSAVGLGHDPAGWWTSGEGQRVHLWANEQQVVVTIDDRKYGGQWTKPGEQFYYDLEGGQRAVCTFVEEDEIAVEAQGQSQRWQRAEPEERFSLDGPWRSTSGSLVKIESQGSNIYLSISGRSGSRNNGTGRWVKFPSRFVYSIPGFPGEAVGEVLEPSKIKVTYGGRVTFWQR